MKFLVAIKMEGHSELFEFNTELDRLEFIKETLGTFPDMEYATSEAYSEK